MTTFSRLSDWDLTPVRNLVQSLSHRSVEPPTLASSAREIEASSLIDNHVAFTGNSGDPSLGDFNRLWDFLGVQHDVPTSTRPTFEVSTAAGTDQHDAYASDGVLYYPPSSKSVKWRDEEEGNNLTDVQPPSPPTDTPMTKTQRKKRNRKARKAAEAAETTAAVQPVEADYTESFVAKSSSTTDALDFGAVADNEAEIPPLPKADAVLKPIHNRNISSDLMAQIHKAASTVHQATNDSQKISHKSSPSNVTRAPAPAAATPSRNTLSRSPNDILRPAAVVPSSKKVPTSATHMPIGSSTATLKTPTKSIKNNVPASAPPAAHIPTHKEWPKVQSSSKTLGTPPRPLVSSSTSTPGPAQLSTSAFKTTTTQPSTTSGRKRWELLPVAFTDPTDRNWSLLLKLMNNFPEDRKSLLSPLQLSINRPVTDGIHVFVDASNIVIGFHETLKRNRGIPYYAHVPRVNLNFHALALLLERRRAISKRVLAGSTPEITAFEEARQVGYETCILDKVYKSKELTERQRRFATRGTAGSNGYQSGGESAENAFLSTFAMEPSVSDSASAALPPQQPKWVEQAVDEILHLKILESIVDTPIPAGDSKMLALQPNGTTSPTMVLATGDAAEAEYSSGFMKMVQRALTKGWNVEVVAWSKSTSMDYRRMEQSDRLAGRFRIIELDEYAEELFGEAV